MKPAVELLTVCKDFGGCPTIRGLNLTVGQGEAIGLTGPSGVGKSTVLRMVAGLEFPDSGRVRVHAAPVGYVFQEPRLLPWSTVLENVALPLLAQGVKRTQALARSRNQLRHMELEDYENAYPRHLSGGMRQRVALARALSVEPKILLLDEPFNGLDARLKHDMGILLEAALRGCGAALIHVTHDPDELTPCTSRIVHMDRRGSLSVPG